MPLRQRVLRDINNEPITEDSYLEVLDGFCCDVDDVPRAFIEGRRVRAGDHMAVVERVPQLFVLSRDDAHFRAARAKYMQALAAR